MTQNALTKLAYAAAALLVPVSAAVAAEADDWSFDVSPYLWIATVEVETGVRPASYGVRDFDTRISGGAMLAAQARYRSVGLFVDFAWLQLNTEAVNPGPSYSDVDLRSDFIHTTMALTYTLPFSGRFHADILAGARLWHVNETLEFESGTEPGFETEGDDTWVDPVIGAALRYDLSKRWSLTAMGTVGGFGVSSEMAYEVFGGVSYRITGWWSTTLGYRYLHDEYTRDRLALNLDAHGFLLGFGFHF